MDLVKETEDPSNNTNRADQTRPPAPRPSSARDVSGPSPDSCNHAFNSRGRSVRESCQYCGLDRRDDESDNVPGPVINGQDRLPLSREQRAALSHDDSHDIWDADFGTSSINGYTSSATLATRSTASRTMIVSQIDESEGDSVDMPVDDSSQIDERVGGSVDMPVDDSSQIDERVGGSVDMLVDDSSQPLLADYRPRRLPPSTTMTSHGLDNYLYQPLSQGPSPWSPYHLYRADVARRALENVELHQLSEDTNGRETPGPERDLDLGD